MNFPSPSSPWHHSILPIIIFIPSWPSEIMANPKGGFALWAQGLCRCLWPGQLQFLMNPCCCCSPVSTRAWLPSQPGLGMGMIPSLCLGGMHSKIAVAFPPNSLTFHLYFICYLLSLSESFLHCCPLFCSPVFYFCLLFLFFFPAPWEKCLAFIHFQTQTPGFNPSSELSRFFCAPSLLLPFASNLPRCFPRTKLVWFSFSSGSQPLISLIGSKDGKAMNLSENQINFLLILLFFFRKSLLSGHQGQWQRGWEAGIGEGFLMAAVPEGTQTSPRPFSFSSSSWRERKKIKM